MTPTRDQIIRLVNTSPGITTLAILEHFAPFPTPPEEVDRTYHCIRVKLSVLSKRGEIHREDSRIPGRPAEWYPGASA